MLAFALLLGIAAPLAGAAAAPPAWTVVPDQSRITFSGEANGSPFEGRFEDWSASIAFDPKDLAQSSATVTIDTGSAKTGDDFQETTLQALEWFNIAEFPKATFATRSIRTDGPDRYVAEGTVTVKSKSVPVTLPFTLKPEAGGLRMQGSTTLDRVALDLGAQSDPNGTFVSQQIQVKVDLLARKGK